MSNMIISYLIVIFSKCISIEMRVHLTGTEPVVKEAVLQMLKK